MNLNIGAGKLNRTQDEIAIDVDSTYRPDIQASCERLPFKDNSFDEVRAYHVLEHVRDIVSTMNECHRVLKPNGTMKIRVPGFPNMQAVVDPTHVRFFIPDTFGYFSRLGALTGLKHVFQMDDLHVDGWEIYCTLKKGAII